MLRLLFVSALFSSALFAATVFVPVTSYWEFSQANGNATFNITANTAVLSALPIQNGIQGVKGSGGYSATRLSGGNLGSTVASSVSMSYIAEGTFSGDPFPSGNFPFAFDMNVSSNSSSNALPNWSVALLINNNFVFLQSGFTGANPNNAQITGNSSITPPLGVPTTWKIIATGSAQLKNNEFLSISIPSNSIDINPITSVVNPNPNPNPVPEPSTSVLIGVGLLLLPLAGRLSGFCKK